MNKIDLNPKKLLGFKLVASNGATMALQSPKIGAKQCVVVGMSAVVASDAKPAHQA